MNKIILISGHPDISYSTANRIIMEELLADENVAAYDIQLNYPDYNFDVDKEQHLLLSAGLIILQAPFMWYGLPAHVRLWIEKVFTWGFAHGPGGDKLKGKSFLLSLTMGGDEKAYSHLGHHQHPVGYFLKPIELFARYCGLKYLPPVYSFGMNARPDADNDNCSIKTKSILHAWRIKGAVQQSIMSGENVTAATLLL
jgi:putative NADPH-quinone reductase